jgi:hypothetical protein
MKHRQINQEQWTRSETELLNMAVEKMALIGEQVGVTPDDMIALLDSGYSIRELLMLLVSKRSGAPHD